MDRRSFLILVAVSAGCSPQPPEATQPPTPVWITIDADGLLVVNGARADAATIDAVVLEQALALNPTLTPEQARADVQVYFRGYPTAPPGAYQDVVRALQRIRFEHVGIVAEDRR
ncbi:MAG: hypothetical protein K2X34_05430 [Hyphomonadaceae bacterium]|nr:hypothetical protein [Hyphomonadaceae bacterium]